MTERQTERQPDTPPSRLWRVATSFVPYALIGVVAVLLRVLDLGGYLTVDEATTWVPNSYRLMRVLLSGNYEDTPFMGHPAITTMWLGMAGVVLRRALFDWGLLHHETYELVLALNRLPIALVTAGGIVAAYALMRRVLPLSVATLAAFLWATDPFIVAFSRVLHMDVLMGTFATLCLLTAFLYWYRAPRRRWLVVSAMCAGLAVLSKLPALLLFPLVGLIALSMLWYGSGDSPARPGVNGWAAVGRRIVLPLLVWGVLCGATVVALWPTFWTNPVRAYEALRYGVEVEGGNPHLEGNYFLGRPDPEPGLHFYPVALVMRMTPWAMVGILLLPLAVRHYQDQHSPAQARDMRLLSLLIVWVILFMAGMSMFPLKFNRYLVPVFPAVNILAAVGFVGAGRWLTAWWARRQTSPHPRGAAVVRLFLPVVVGVAGLVNAAWYHPYSIVYFNQALGGAQTGARTFLAGWGEGLDQVADWLNAQPDITSVVTVCRLDTLINPYLRELAYATRANDGRMPDGAGYLVAYYRHVQWGQEPPPYDNYYGHAIPLHTVTLHGVDYAWIYQVPREMPNPLEASFGASLRLHGYDIDTSSVRASGTLTLTAQWHVQAPIPDDYALFVHVFDEQGQQVAQLDVPLLDPHEPTSTWQPGRSIYWVHPVPMMPDVPPGDYWLALGIYHPDDFSRLPLEVEEPLPNTPDDGPHVLFLEPVRIP